jgi:hypothetical protein
MPNENDYANIQLGIRLEECNNLPALTVFRIVAFLDPARQLSQALAEQSSLSSRNDTLASRT